MIERMKNQKDALKPDDATMNYVSMNLAVYQRCVVDCSKAIWTLKKKLNFSEIMGAM